MSKELVISASSHERRVAILEEGQLVEIYIEREKEFALVGSIYKGKVTRVLPGMQSAFVDIGLDGDAFLYVSDVFENLEDYDHGHGPHDAPAPAIVNGHSNAPREVLPGESLSAGTIHEEIVHLDEPGIEHAASEDTAIEGLPGEVRQGRSISDEGAQPGFIQETAEPDERQPESNASAPQNFAPNYNPTRSYPPRGNDRGPSRDRGDRAGDRGGDRGRGGRRGRFGRRRGGSERPPMNQGGGRNLPPSKYASPQGDRDSRGGYENRRPGDRGPERGGERGPSAPIPSVEDEIVLPGESLAKYRSRPAATPVAPVVEQEPEERQPDFTETPSRPAVGLQPGGGVPRRFSGSLPHWLLAENEPGGEALTGDSASEQTVSEAIENATTATEETEEAASEHVQNGASSLSDEHLKALSAQLVEAKHEETQARAAADTVIEEVEFEEEEEETGEVEEEDPTESAREEEQLHEDAEHEEAEQDETRPEGSGRRETKEEAEMRRDAEHEEAEAYRAEEEKHEEMQVAEIDGQLETGEVREHTESISTSTEGGTEEAIGEEDVILLPGETRAPRNPSAPREEFARRDSARIGSNPRSRFQRPQRGGRDRDRGRGGDRGGRPDRGRGGDRGGRGRFEPRRSSGGSAPSHGGQQRSPQGGHSHGHGHAPQRRPQLISEMLKAGQDVVIQIAKEPLGKKGARITSHVALPGRFLVYMPTIDHIGVSRKIASADNRSRLRRLVGEARGSYPGGFIVRTAAGEATDEEIRTDIEFLGKTWNEIKQKSEERKSPALLHRDLNLVERILRDYVSDDFTAIWIDNEEEYGKVVEFVSRFQPKLVNRVKLYTKEQPIFEEFGIQHELDKALRAKVWLKSGGYIVINHTEALVAIDVNTGKFVGKGSTRLEDTIVKTNLEAVKEIVRQIRLRDLGGIIVVDFIDMEERRNREKVLAALQFALDQDKAPSKALSFNEFGLVCITRKRTKQALERVLCQPCPSCSGSGMVKSVPTLCYEIQAEARKMAAADHEGPNLTLRVHPEIAKALKTRESLLVDELEQNSHKHIIIQSDPTLHWEQYDIY
jgi:Rne/Rng family ribonuclease